MSDQTDVFSTPPAFLPLLTKQARYKVYWGGRGSGKSWAFAGSLVYIAARAKIRVLCAREIQTSIADSVHKLLKDEIARRGLDPYFRVTNNSIVSHTGAEFLFKGLRHNVNEIKSTEGVDICWVEEAQRVSEESWQLLIPTIRKPDSEIWVSFNPDNEYDPTYKRYVASPPPDSLVKKVSWRDNPWFPVELDKERQYLQSVDPDAYAHVWEGECRNVSDAQILKNKYSIEEFVPGEGWSGPYYGADWGFANDPTVVVKLWINGSRLYVEHEAWGVGVDIDKTAALFDRVPGAREHTMRADCARPETISYMQRHGYPRMVAADKWSGSVEDGIAFLRQFERIVIHPRCEHTALEARLYSYKVDRLSGDVLPDVVDANNHCIDAIRYALTPLISQRGLGMLDYMREMHTRHMAHKRNATTATT